MTPEDILEFLAGIFPQLVREERHNPDGWSFFYQRRGSGRRIITVTRSSATAPTRLLRVISRRLGTGGGYVPFEGNKEQLRKLVNEEIRLYEEHFGGGAVEFRLPDEIDDDAELIEGAVRCVMVNAYERNPEARRRCIDAHGTTCCICGFSFGAVYGEGAEGYIHVHHLRPLSEVSGEYVVDPVKDLRPVCPNCHAVLHLGGQCRSIEEVRQMVGDNRA